MFQSVNEFPFWISDTLTHITLAPKIEKKSISMDKELTIYS